MLRLILTILMLPSIAYAGAIGDAQSLVGQMNTPAKWQSRVAAPTTSEANLVGFDGTPHGNIKLTCASSGDYLKLAVIPSASGDLQLTTTQDINGDGVPEKAYSPAGLVSAVCANGVKICTLGTDKACQNMAWVAAMDGSIGLSAVAAQNLGGCFMVNNSAGGAALFLQNHRHALEKLGGGIMAAVGQVRADIIPGSPVVGTLTISYPASICAGNAPSGYYANQQGLTDAGSAELTNQQATTDSVLSTITTGVNGNTATSCQIRRDYTVTQQADVCTTTLPTFTKTSFRTCTNGHTPLCIGDCSKLSIAPLTSQQPAGSTNVGYFLSGNLGSCGGNTGTSWLDTVRIYKVPPKTTCVPQPDIVQENVVDTCGLISSDCRLQYKTVDGVQILKNYNPTSLASLPITKTFVINGLSTGVKRDWWLIEKKYTCDAPTIDTSDAVRRKKTLDSSLTFTGDQMNYTDGYKQDGVWSTRPGSGKIQTGSASCEMICNVSWLEELDTNTATNGAVANKRISKMVKRVEPRRCEGFSATGYSCPTTNGETISTQCGCKTNGLAEAATIFNIVSGLRPICSNGVLL